MLAEHSCCPLFFHMAALQLIFSAGRLRIPAPQNFLIITQDCCKNDFSIRLWLHCLLQEKTHGQSCGASWPGTSSCQPSITRAVSGAGKSFHLKKKKNVRKVRLSFSEKANVCQSLVKDFGEKRQASWQAFTSHTTFSCIYLTLQWSARSSCMDISWDHFRLESHLSRRECKTLGCRLQTRGLAETIRAAKWNSCLKPLQLCRQYFARGCVNYPGDKCLATPFHLQNVLCTGYSVIRLYRFDCVREEGFLVGITHLSCRIEISLPMTCLFLPVLRELTLKFSETEKQRKRRILELKVGGQK